MDNYIDIQDSRLSSKKEEPPEKVVALQQRQIAGVLTFAAALARRMGLTVSEMAALEHLHASGQGLTITELGGRLSMSSGTVSPLVDRLERRGYVERRPNPADRRSSVVRMTAWGIEESSNHLIPLANDLLGSAKALSGEHRAVVGGYLEAVAETLERHSGVT